MRKRIVQLCERNVQVGGGAEVKALLEQQYGEHIEVRVMDCFRRCLECRQRPFCRMQVQTLEADSAPALVEKIAAAAHI